VWKQGPSQGGGGKAGTLELHRPLGSTEPDLGAVEELLERLSIQSRGAVSKKLPTLPASSRGGQVGGNEDEYDAAGIYDTDDSVGSRD
jgi:hypothetical protein